MRLASDIVQEFSHPISGIVENMIRFLMLGFMVSVVRRLIAWWSVTAGQIDFSLGIEGV